MMGRFGTVDGAADPTADPAFDPDAGRGPAEAVADSGIEGSEGPAPKGANRFRGNSKAVLALVLVGMIIVGGAGIGVGTRLKSPDQVAAETAAPEASLVTAAVVRQQLSSNIVTRGTIRFSDPLTVSVSGSVGAAGTQLVTRTVEQGATLNEGDEALTVSGRPVFVLEGTVPMYRSIGLGDSGDDVRQMEDALVRLGYDPGTVDGSADAAFMNAVKAFYEARGHEAPDLTDAQKAEQRTLTEAVRTAEREVVSARTAVDAAAKPVSDVDRLRADAAVQTARDALDAANRSATGDAETARAEVTNKQRALDEARSTVTTATATLDRANRQKTAAQALDPADPSAVTEAEQAVTEATTALAAANRAVTGAQAELDAANRALTNVAPTSEAAKRQAAANLALAEAERKVLDGPRDTASPSAQLKAAEDAVQAAKDNLTRFQADNGTTVPSGEIIFVPTATVRVDEVKVKVGDTVTGPVLVLSGTELAVDTAIASADRDLVRVGAEVSVTASDFDITTTGKVSLVEAKPGTRGVDKQQVYVAVTLDDPNLAADLSGASVRVTIPVDSTAGEVLTVPVSAVTTKANGETSVLVQDGATTREVKVTTGLAAGGDVEVTAVGGALAAGDRVVVNGEQP